MDDHGHVTRARLLLLITAALVAYGSLYPFTFAAPPDPYAALQQLLSDRRMWSGLGDVAGNVLLFIPLGFGGVFAQRQSSRVLAARTIFIACVIAFAFALQAAQIFLPSRSAAMSDVVYNAVGLLAGMAIGAMLRRLPLGGAAGAGSIEFAPISLILIWLCVELWPFVPTIDLQQYKNALKPLLKAPQWNAWSAADVGLGLAIVAHMMRSMRRPLSLLAAVAAASGLGSVVIIGHQLSASRVAGLTIGLVAGAAILRARQDRASHVLLVAALLWFVTGELRPFEMANDPQAFHWLPFEAMLVGSMQANLIALVWNLFWLGAILTLVKEQGGMVAPAAIGLSALVLGLEIAQAWMPNRTADLTPALLPFLWALALAGPLGRGRTPPGVPASLRDHASDEAVRPRFEIRR